MIPLSMTLSDLWPHFKVTAFFEVEYLKKCCVLGVILLKNTNRKPCTIFRMVPLSMTLSELWPRFQGHDILKSNIVKTAPHKDKVTIAEEETMEWYYVLWPWLTTKCVTRVCQHQLNFLLKVDYVDAVRMSGANWSTAQDRRRRMLACRDVVWRE